MKDEDHNSIPSVRVTLNPNGIRAPLDKLLSESLENVSVGLAAVENYSSAAASRLPSEYVRFTYSQPVEPGKRLPRREVQRRKENFKLWLLTRGFEECSKALLASLRQAYLYVEVVKLPGRTTAGELTSAIEAIRRKAARLNFPQLIDAVIAGLTEQPLLVEHVHSINKVRNCLEHRNGTVSQIDVNDDTTNSLVLKWRRMRLVVLSKDGEERDLVVPSVVEGGSAIAVRFEDRAKTFALGEAISLTAAEFNDVAFTCQAFASEVVSKLPELPQAPAS